MNATYKWRAALCALAAALCLAGCADNPHLEAGKRLSANGKPEQAISELEEGLRKEPGNLEIRAELEQVRGRLVNRYIAEGESDRMAGKLEAAEAGFRRALKVVPGIPRAEQGLQQVDIDRRHQAQLSSAAALLAGGDLAGAEKLARIVLTQNPRQSQARKMIQDIEQSQAAAAAAALPGPAMEKPVTLQFRDAPIGAIFDILSRTAGLNFVLDKEVRPDIKATVFVTNSTVREVVNLVLATTQLASKTLNANSILIYPNTPAKVKEYQELVTKTFYLANADVKQAQDMIKQIVKSRDVFINDKLNMLVIKDTPEAVRLAEKILDGLDKAEPEVMLDVEVLEISRNNLLALGPQFPDQIGYGKITPDVVNTVITTTGTSTSTVFGGALAPGNVDLRNGVGLTTYVANPAILLNIKGQDGSSKLLANPRIRVKNREKAHVHIGDKVPVFTTTSTANVGVSASVTYLDVGIKLDVQPSVSLDDEVSIKVALEVSSIGREVPGPGGSFAYQIGTRAAETSLRLHDGETQVLAGLISDEERKAADRVPGLGNLPVLGRLFSSTRDTNNKTEIVLLITPRIVSNISRPEVTEPAIPSGSDSVVGRAPLTLNPSTNISMRSSGADTPGAPPGFFGGGAGGGGFVSGEPPMGRRAQALRDRSGGVAAPSREPPAPPSEPPAPPSGPAAAPPPASAPPPATAPTPAAPSSPPVQAPPATPAVSNAPVSSMPGAVIGAPVFSPPLAPPPSIDTANPGTPLPSGVSSPDVPDGSR